MTSTQKGNEVAKMSLFAKDMGIYITVSIESTRRLSDLQNTFRKLASYKINIPKSKSPCIPKINPLRKKSGKELNQPKTYLGKNLNKEMKNIDSENCKKKLRLTLEDGKISHAIGLVRLIL